MKTIRRKMIWSVIIGIAGMALLAVNLLQNNESSTMTYFASGIVGVSIIRFFQIYRISKTPKLLKKYEIMQKEERLISIAEKSGRFTFLLIIFMEFSSIFALIIFNLQEVATIVSYVLGIQVFIYLCIYYYLSKKF